MVKFRYIDLAIDAASESDCHIRVGAVAVNKSEIVWAYNLRKGDPQLVKNGYPAYAGQHAEYRLTKLFPMAIRGATIYVARVNKRGEPRLAKPCAACEAKLRKSGAKRVTYTTNVGCETIKLRRREQG